MSKIEDLLAKHKKEIEDLQEECKHEKISDWMDEWWAPGHSTFRQVKVCEECNKIVETRDMINLNSGIIVSTSTANTQNIQ